MEMIDTHTLVEDGKGVVVEFEQARLYLSDSGEFEIFAPLQKAGGRLTTAAAMDIRTVLERYLTSKGTVIRRNRRVDRLPNRRNSSGFSGVYRNKKGKTWIARVQEGGEQVSIGSFKDKKEACEVILRHFHNNVGIIPSFRLKQYKALFGHDYVPLCEVDGVI